MTSATPAVGAPATPRQRAGEPPRAAALRFLADATLVLDRLGDRAAVAAIRAEVDRLAGGAATVVVVGERNSGKSSLINALTGRGGLLPVDADVATNVHVAVHHAPEPAARVVTLDEPAGRAVPLAEVGEYAALDPATGRPRHPDVLEVAVGLPDPLLRGLCLIDTPGVGGLIAGHAAITLATLARADVLLFVTGAGCELTASECRFLAQAAERIATVAFVLTQTDRYPEWPTVLQRDLALLRTHAPRYTGAPWFPVSSRAAADSALATGRGNAERARRLRGISGLDPLAAALTAGVAAEAYQIRLRNALLVTGRAVGRQLTVQRRNELSLSGDPALPADLDRLRGRLASADEWIARRRSRLTERGRVLERDQRLQLKRRIIALRDQLLDLARGGDRELIEALPDELARSVHAIWLDQQTWLRGRLAELCAELADLAGPGADEVNLALPEHLRDLAGPARGAANASAVDRILPSIGLGSLAAGLTGALVAGFLAPAVVGLGTVLVLYERRRRKDAVNQARQDAARYVTQVLAQVEVELPAAAQAALEQALRRLRDSVAEGVEAWRAELDAALAEHERLRAGAGPGVRERTADALAALTQLTTRHAGITAALGDQRRGQP
ncbi:dynamin family protein [Actinoplanes sp. NPDC049668]|uniref:dynamin family protein n=1 Tax=unclassified Actinoplanes TaxID=2626549 RepID=UPI0033AA9149